MTVLTRYFLGMFLAAFAWVLLLVHLFVALASLVGFLTRYPFLPLPTLVGRLPDLVLLELPISLPFSALVGAILFTERIRERRGFLLVQLAGRDPRRHQWPILLTGVALGAALLWLHDAVLPQVRFRAKQVVTTVREDPLSLAIRLAEDPELIEGYRLTFERLSGGVLEDVALLSESGSAAVTARRATVEFAPAADVLRVVLDEGRYLTVGEDGEVDWNLRFDRLALGFDAAALGGPAKTDLLDLRYYTNAELDRLPEQARHLFRRGIRPTRNQLLRVRGAEAMCAVRLQWAALPFLFLLLVVCFLGVHRPRAPRRRTFAVAAFCLLLLLPLTILVDSAARDGRLDHVALAGLPTYLTAAALLVAPAARRIAGGRRP